MGEMFFYKNFKTINKAIENIQDIINFEGNRHHGYDWYILRYGEEEAVKRITQFSESVKGLNNPIRFNNDYKLNFEFDSLYSIINRFKDKNDVYFINPENKYLDFTFYIIELHNGYFKFGITSNLKKRFNINKYKNVIKIYNSSLYNSIILETLFRYLNIDNIINESEKECNFGFTESIKNVTSEKLLNDFNIIKNNL